MSKRSLAVTVTALVASVVIAVIGVAALAQRDGDKSPTAAETSQLTDRSTTSTTSLTPPSATTPSTTTTARTTLAETTTSSARTTRPTPRTPQPRVTSSSSTRPRQTSSQPPIAGPRPGSACTKPFFTTSNSNGGITTNGYYVHNNLWNAAKYPGTKGTTQVCSYRSWNHIGTASNASGSGEVKTYPNVHRDYSGRTISSFPRLTSTFAATSPRRGIYNVSYDLWLNGVPNDEVMIWTDNYRQVPAGSRFASRVSLGGHSWDVYATSGNGYIAFVPSGGARITSGTLDIKAMLNYLVARGRVSASATVDQICYGVEIVDTGGRPATWYFTNFSLTDS